MGPVAAVQPGVAAPGAGTAPRSAATVLQLADSGESEDMETEAVRLDFIKSDATRTDIDQTTYADAKLDGVTLSTFFKSGKKTGKHAPSPAVSTILTGAGYEWKRNKPPHAEDYLIYDILQNDRQGNILSIRIDRAPCSRCARNLIKLKTDRRLVLRIKAAQCRTADQVEGLRLLAADGAHFRLWTIEQRENKFGTKTEEAWKERVEGSVGATNKKYVDALVERERKQSADLANVLKLYPNATKEWREQGLTREALTS